MAGLMEGTHPAGTPAPHMGGVEETFKYKFLFHGDFLRYLDPQTTSIQTFDNFHLNGVHSSV